MRRFDGIAALDWAGPSCGGFKPRDDDTLEVKVSSRLELSISTIRDKIKPVRQGGGSAPDQIVNTNRTILWESFERKKN